MRSKMRTVGQSLYLLFSWLFVAGVVYQVYLAGLAAVAQRQGWGPHIEIGHTLGAPLLLMILTMYLGRLPRRVKSVTWLLFFIYIIQVYVLVILLRRSAPSIAALHPVLALVDFGLGVWLAIQAVYSVRGARNPIVQRPNPENTFATQGD